VTDLEEALSSSLEGVPVAQPERRIGGTMIGALLGLSSWGNRSDVWLSLVLGYEKRRTAGMSRGLLKEDDLRRWYVRKHGHIVGIGELTNSEWPFLVGHPDAVRGDTVIDFKTANRWRTEKWQEGAPLNYVRQVEFYGMLGGWSKWELAVSFGEDVRCEACEACKTTPVPRGSKMTRPGCLAPQFIATEEEPRIYHGDVEPAHCAEMLTVILDFKRDWWDTGIPPPEEPVNHKRDWKRLRAKAAQGDDVEAQLLKLLNEAKEE
jgi:hypothetical protein